MERASQAPKKTKSGVGIAVWVLIPVLAALVPVYFTVLSGDPFAYLIPNALMFTGYRALTRDTWAQVTEVDTSVAHEPQHIPSIDAAEYTFEKLREITEGFRYPAVVRGLFLNTTASEKWNQPGYLASKIGHFNIPVVISARANSTQEERSLQKFATAYGNILEYGDVNSYLFFPVKSRLTYNHSDAGSTDDLIEIVNQLVLDDLEVNKRIWNGFGTKDHNRYRGAQFIVGNGDKTLEDTTGSGWHCAIGNNWFVQVFGKKRWHFLDPKYSSMLHPVRGGLVHIMTSWVIPGLLPKHLPIRYVDLEAGDLLYNPDWEWHNIRNYEGLSFGVPIREANLTLSFRNNFQYTSIVLINKLLEQVGLDIGGYQY